MILATYLINKDRERATAEGITIGIAQGKNTAYQRANAEFAAYHRRMRAAIDFGETFNEPPPYFPIQDED